MTKWDFIIKAYLNSAAALVPQKIFVKDKG